MKLKNCTISNVYELSENLNLNCLHGDAFHELTHMLMTKM